MANNKKIEHEYTNEMVCPYCGYKFRDTWDYEVGESSSTIECENDECGEDFEAWANVSVDYSTSKRENKGEITI